MAAKGTIAKENIAAKLVAAFGEDFLGKIDNKWYVQADDGGQKVQIAISMTCPKTQVEFAPWDMPSAGDVGSQKPAEGPVEITDKERETIADMMKKLGL